MSGAAEAGNELSKELEALRARVKELEGAEVKRERTEKALYESEAKYRTLVEHVPAITYTTALDETSTTLFVSPQVQSLLGYTQAEFKADPDIWRKSLHPDDRERVLAEVKRAHDTGTPFVCEYRMLARDGREVWFRDEAVQVRDETGRPVVLQGLMLDVSARKQAEKALRESEERYRVFAERNPHGIQEIDATGTILFANHAHHEMYGCKEGELVGRSIAEFLVPGPQRDGLPDYLESLAKDRPPPTVYLQVIRLHDGQDKDIEVCWDYLPDEDGGVRGYLSVLTDVTERKRAEEELRRAECIVSSSTDMLALLDENYVYLAGNQTYAEAFGKTREDLLGHTAAEVFGQKFFDTTIRPYAERCLAGEEVRYEVWFDFPVSGRQYMDIAYFPYTGADGQIKGFVVCGRDSTERRRAEDALRDSEERFRALFDGMSSGVAVYKAAHDGSDFVIVDFNRAGERIESVAREDIVGRRITDVFPSVEEFGLLDVFRRVWQTGEPQHHPITLYKDERISGWRENFVYRLPSGEVVALYDDITERKRAEEALRESEARLREMANTIEDVFWVTDWAEKRTVFASSAYEKVWGRSLQELYNDPGAWTNAIHPDDRERAWQKFLNLEQGRTYDEEYRITRPDGSTQWIRDRGFPVPDEHGLVHRVVGVAQDITERKRAEESLLSEKLLSENYINSLPGLFYVFDDQRLVRWNREWGRVTGYSDEELACRYGPDFVEGEDKELIEERMLEVFRKGASGAEVDLVTKDGRRIPYYFTGLRREFNGKPHLVGLGIDITDRKKAEEEQRQLEEQLRQSQKMEAVGQLAGGVAHDFNNVLTAILGNAELLLSILADDSRKDSREMMTRGLEQIQSAGERAAALTRRLLAFSGKRPVGREMLETQQIVADTEEMLRQLIRENITLDVTVDPNTSRVCMGSGQIEQILMNLVLNARDALPKGGLIRVICGNVTLSERQVAGHPSARPGRHVMINVTDNGTGMDKETVGRVFDPFFTTKPVGRGTGLGLAVVYGAVKQIEGHITVESEVGKGTTFRVYLPAAEGEIASLAPPPPLRESCGDEVILVCEDEELVRQITCRVLREAGYGVLEACSGEEALKIAASQKKPVDLLVTDVIMPGMNGRELADEIARRYPSVRIVLVSGYTADVAGDAVSKGRDAEFLQKPFSPTVLLERVRKVLDLGRA